MSTPSPVKSGGEDSNTGNSNSGGRNRRAKKHGAKVVTKFEGEFAELKGFVYDCVGPNQADQYIKTTKHIANYFSSKTDKAGSFQSAIINLTIPTVPKIKRPTPKSDGTYDEMDKLEYSKQFERYERKVELIEELNRSLYPMVWSQCSDAIKERLKRHPNFDNFSTEHDGIELLRAIKSISHNVLDINYPAETMHEALYNLVAFKQTSYMTVEQYHEQFINRRDTYILTGGHKTGSPIMQRLIAIKNKVWDKNGNPDVTLLTDDDQEEAFELDMATLFLRNADKHRFGQYHMALKDSYLDGDNRYPTTVYDAYTRLLFRNKSNNHTSTVNSNDGVAFATNGQPEQNNNVEREVVLATNGRTGNKSKRGKRSDSESGNNKGDETSNHGDKDKDNNDNHSNSNVNAYMCPSSRLTSTVNAITGNIVSHLFNTSPTSIPNTWILLDNQSTVDVFCNQSLLTSVRDSNTMMTIQCNAGSITTTTIGSFRNYGDVWYCENGIANILSFANARNKGCRIDYNFHDNTFTLQQQHDSDIVFQQSPNGLYYYDTNINSATVLVNTVEENKAKYSHRDFLRAKAARDLMIKIGRPSLQQFLHILDHNQLPNCPITRRDAIIAESIFGPDIGSLKGKTVNRAPQPVHIPLNDLPENIMAQYQQVTLCGDIMFVNKIPFFVTISRHIHFSTVEMIANRQPDTILTSIKAVLSIYHQRGFKVSTILLDGEFKPLRDSLATLGVQMNPTANDEHVPEIERHIRTLKERTRCIYNTLPFEHMAPRLIIEMVYTSSFWINAFPYQHGISDVLSPRQIVTGSTIDFNRHCRLAFGTYVQTHEVHDNTMLPRTIGALALRPTGNAQGGFHFYNLSSGRVISRNRWTEVPMPNEVIAQVTRLARRANAARGPLAFLNRYGFPIDDDDVAPDGHLDALPDDASDDSSFIPDDDGDHDDISDADDDHDDDAALDAPDVPIALAADLIPPDADHIFDIDPALPRLPGSVETPGVDDIMDDVDGFPDDADDVDDVPGIAELADIPGVDDADPDVEPVLNPDIDPVLEIPGVNENPDPDAGVNENPDPDAATAANQNTIDAQMNDIYGERTSQYDLRPRRERNYDHLFTQHSIKKGLQVFGDAGAAAVIKELNQLHDLKVIVPVDPKLLTKDDKSNALQYLMFLKQKRCGKIKGRGCADGRKQRTYMTKEDTSSPTVAIESVYLSCVIDADEQRDVAIVDIPGAFLHADMNDKVYMRIDGDMAKMLLDIAPDVYGPFLTYTKNNQPVLYVLLEKALYGTLQAALLFWEKLSGILTAWGFVINPYDRCVANKVINGSICTILWHVDDLKISHVDADVVTEIIQQLSDEFGHVAPLTVHRGKKHDYLGMQLDFSTPSKVKISMYDYINKILDDAPANMNGTAPTPAANHLFEVNSTNPTFLNAVDAELFHHMVAQLLFLCKRARPDIQTAVSFLCTRVQKPDTDDYKKLARVIKYLRGSISLPLTLEASNTKMMQWWVDASYGVHPDMKSHTGGVLSLGKGAVYATSTRQKINTKSSTEAELVGVNDVLPQALWTKYFLQEQGYGCTESILYQDNQSAMLLEKNGRASSSKRTRHINIRYYFVTDKIQNKEVTLAYCPTDEMVADFFTKPLQGQKFRHFRDFILNIDPTDDIVLLNVSFGSIPPSAHHGCSLLHYGNHRSVLNGSPGMSDWLLVTRRHKLKKIQRIENANLSARRKGKD